MNHAPKNPERAILFLSPLSSEINDDDISSWPMGPSQDTECVVVPETIFYRLAEAIEGHITIQDLSDTFDTGFVTCEEDSIFDIEKLKLFAKICFKAATGLDEKKTKNFSDRKHEVVVALLYSISAMCDRAALRGSGLIIYT